MQGERLDIQIPQEDGSIAKALADLDTKVFAWASACRTAESHLAEMAASCRRRTESAPSSQVDQPVSDPLDSESSVAVDNEQPDVPLDLVPDSDVSAHSEPTVGEQRTEVSEAIDEPQPVVDRKSEQVHMADVSVDPVAEKAEEVSQDSADPHSHADEHKTNDDAALLASLDSETAKAIRVMRRLAPVKTSVRELLAEYEATKVHEHVEEPRKKSWFRSRR